MLGNLLREILGTSSPKSVVEARRLDTAPRPDAPAGHLEILYRGVTVGTLEFLNLYEMCLRKTATGVPEWKRFRRAQRALNLAQYYRYSLTVEGARAECGVFRGFSALLLCHIARDAISGYTGQDLYLIDSFEGLSAPTDEDRVKVYNPQSKQFEHKPAHAKGHFETPVAHVRNALSEFSDARIMRGWIPEVFSQLPETPWSFVHIDVDLFEPTLACLEYFHPRLSAGGVIINDDYASPNFPGGGKAWDQYCNSNNLEYITLDTGQAVLIKSPPNPSFSPGGPE